MSLEEFLALPETEPPTELIDGYPCQKPVGKTRHSRAQTNLILLLARSPATAGGRPWVELGFRGSKVRPGNLRVPDVAFSLPGNEPNDDEDYPGRAPDLAAEVRSEGQSIRHLEGRLAFLRELGTRCTLLIDPETKSVRVHDGEHSWLAAGDDEVVLESLGGFSFRVSELWR